VSVALEYLEHQVAALFLKNREVNPGESKVFEKGGFVGRAKVVAFGKTKGTGTLKGLISAELRSQARCTGHL
jgi:hypothetical protein